MDWTPVVYTPSNPHYPVLDETLAKDVPDEVEMVQFPIWEPYGFYKRLMGMKKEDRVQHGFIAEKGQSRIWRTLVLAAFSSFFSQGRNREECNPRPRFRY